MTQKEFDEKLDDIKKQKRNTILNDLDGASIEYYLNELDLYLLTNS